MSWFKTNRALRNELEVERERIDHLNFELRMLRSSEERMRKLLYLVIKSSGGSLRVSKRALDDLAIAGEGFDFVITGTGDGGYKVTAE